MWDLNFISEEDFEKNIKNTILKYFKAVETVDLSKFNNNTIDPVKLLFDMKVYGKDEEALILDEINRQIDKTNSNSIGYFHQDMFRYIENCERLDQGWDISFTNFNNQKVYIEMKNKHNTMNNDSATKLYNDMQEQLVEDPNCICYLVEIISKKSQNVIWNFKKNQDERMRKVSIDKFYEEVTGDPLAFRKLCDNLINRIDDIIQTCSIEISRENNVVTELELINTELVKALFYLGFKNYIGFNEE